MPTLLNRLKTPSRRLTSEARALHVASRDPRVPWYAKALAALVLAHTFSPIDLIPDFIPVIGHLDDLIIIPLGIFLTVRMIPPEVMTQARLEAAAAHREGKIRARAGIAVVLSVWLVGSLILAFTITRILEG